VWGMRKGGHGNLVKPIDAKELMAPIAAIIKLGVDVARTDSRGDAAGVSNSGLREGADRGREPTLAPGRAGRKTGTAAQAGRRGRRRNASASGDFPAFR